MSSPVDVSVGLTHTKGKGFQPKSFLQQIKSALQAKKERIDSRPS